MKFSQYLMALAQDAPAEWRGIFLDYKGLKKVLKQLQVHQHGPDACKEGEDKCCGSKEDDRFMEALDAEVHRVNREFSRAAKKVISEASHSEKGSGKSFLGALKQCCLGPCGSKNQLHAETKDHEEVLMERAEWCRRYAQINAVALRKIVKKHDKVCRCKSGSVYLQSVWSGDKRMIGTFLHSPMLDELKSLETILMQKVNGNTAMPIEEDCLNAHERPAPVVQPGRNVHHGTAKPLQSTISVRVSDKISELELVDLPMLPSLKNNGSISQCYERVSGSDPAHQQKEKQTDPKADTSADKDTSSRRQREGELRLAEPKCPDGASEEIKKAFAANTAGINDILDLRNISIGSSHMADADVDPEYVCPICLEAMYQPLGLECGHKFCADCAFSAVGKGNALGTVRAILDHVDPDSACPECRTKGVYIFAVELKETEKLIKQRYTKAWEERAADAKAKEARLRELLAIQRHKLQSTFRTPF